MREHTNLPQSPQPQRADIRLTMNGRAIYFGSTPPIEEDGNVLVPLDSVMKAAGTSYDYNERKKVVRASTNLMPLGTKRRWIR